jgi:hypothetical protein
LLVERLGRLGKPIELRLVGGAAIVLAHDPEDRGLTTDIDALEATDTEAVKAVVAGIADERGLPADWLNFKVMMFAPDPIYPAPRWDVVREVGEVRVCVANPEMLLAMKLHAGRGRRDLDDVDVLLEVCEVRDLARAKEIFETYYAREVLKERVDLYLNQKLGST